MYIYMHICIHSKTAIYLSFCLRIHMYTHAHTRVYIYVHVHTHTHMYVHAHTHTYTCLMDLGIVRRQYPVRQLCVCIQHAHTRVRIRKHTRAHMHTHACTHTPTHAWIFSNTLTHTRTRHTDCRITCRQCPLSR